MTAKKVRISIIVSLFIFSLLFITQSAVAQTFPQIRVPGWANNPNFPFGPGGFPFSSNFPRPSIPPGLSVNPPRPSLPPGFSVNPPRPSFRPFPTFPPRPNRTLPPFPTMRPFPTFGPVQTT